MAAMTDHQIPADDSQGMPGEAATGPSPDKPTGTQDNSLQQLSDVYAELIDTDKPEPSPPNRPTTTPPPEPPPGHRQQGYFSSEYSRGNPLRGPPREQANHAQGRGSRDSRRDRNRS